MHVARSDSGVYEGSIEGLHERSRFQDSIGRDARIDALREELNTMLLQDASTLPPTLITPDAGLHSSANSPRIALAPRAPTVADVVNIGGIHAAVLRSEQQRRTAFHSASDGRRFGIYLPSATASEKNLALHRPGPSTPHVPQERAASLPPASSVVTAALEQRSPRQPQRCQRSSDEPTNDDPPPEYVAFDPYPFFDTERKLRRRSTIQIIETVCKDGLKATTGKVGKSVVKHVEDVGKLAKDVPTAFKEAQVKLSSKRAKGKIRWLEKRNYLSGQERLLTQALVG